MKTTTSASPDAGVGASTSHQATTTPAQAGGLSPAERAACAVSADALATHRLWGALALGCGLAVLLLSLATPGDRLGSTHPGGMLSALLVLAMLERFLASRVLLDARLFNRLARGELPGLAELDTGLQQVLGVPAARAGRPLAPRIEGARRLYRLHLGATAALALLALAAGWPC